MKRIRCYLAAFALVATLSGPVFLQGMGTQSLANAAARHASASFTAGTSARSLAVKRLPPCPPGGSSDC